MGARGVTGKVALNRTMGGGYQQPTYAPGASYAPKISMGRPGTAAPIMRGGSQNYTIKAAANGDYINNFGSGDIVCNREFFTMTEDRPIVKEVCFLPCYAPPRVKFIGHGAWLTYVVRPTLTASFSLVTCMAFSILGLQMPSLVPFSYTAQYQQAQHVLL